MTRITPAERVFLARAETVTENKRTRAKHYQQQLLDLMAERQSGDGLKLKQILNIAEKLESIQAQQDAHTEKVNQLRAKQHADRDIIRLCADANKIAGTDGANFFTKTGKVFENQQETPDEQNDASTRNKTTDV